jgi:general secretion pathway protein G
MKPRRRRGEAGYSLVGLMVGITLMSILMALAMPTWKYIVKNEREEELISRLKQVQRAIERYQRKHGAPPTSLEALVQQHFLRRAYKDPIVKDGKWRLVRPGEPCGAGGFGVPGVPGMPGSVGGPQPSPSPGGRSGTGQTQPGGGTGSTPGLQMGGILAVRTTSTDKGLRLVNGQSRYDQWCVQPGQELVVGKAISVLPGGGIPGGGPGRPGATPLPMPSALPR